MTRTVDMVTLSDWRHVDVSELETLRGKQCEAALHMPTLGELVRCVRQAGHEGQHWTDLTRHP